MPVSQSLFILVWICVWVCERRFLQAAVRVCLCVCEKERICVCVCVFVCDRDRARERERARESKLAWFPTNHVFPLSSFLPIEASLRAVTASDGWLNSTALLHPKMPSAPWRVSVIQAYHRHGVLRETTTAARTSIKKNGAIT